MATTRYIKWRYIRDGLAIVVGDMDQQYPALVTILLRRREVWRDVDVAKHVRR